jgi:hypothetical protein
VHCRCPPRIAGAGEAIQNFEHQSGGSSVAPKDQIQEIKRRYALRLHSQPGVCGVGVEQDETGEYVLTIHLDTDDPEVIAGLPDQIEGHPVKLAQSGPFRKLAS